MLSDELVIEPLVKPLTPIERSVVDALGTGESLSTVKTEEAVRGEVISAAIIALVSRGDRALSISNLVIRGSFQIPITQHPIDLTFEDCNLDYVDASGTNLSQLRIKGSKISSLRINQAVISDGVYLINVGVEIINFSAIAVTCIQFSDVYSSVIRLTHLQDVNSISFTRALRGNLYIAQCDVRELSFKQVEWNPDDSDRIRLRGITAHDVKFYLCKNLAWLHCTFLESQELSFKSMGFLMGDWLKGGVELEDCNITQELRISNSPMNGLKLKRVSTNILADDEASWVPKGELTLQNVSWQERIVEGQYGNQTDLGREWLRLQHNWCSEGYEQLAEEVSRSGDKQMARSLRVEAEQRLREWGMNEIGKSWSRLLRFTTGYGYKTYRIIP